ncbi:MAG TPA: DDE-type integrase/transposase/recombinase [Acidimicrobiales bacterium]|nr:DDE-type integrase/transposase/recombinase [Acidimicrobiales bacterium]
MNRLSTEKRGQVVSLLCEGMSIRSIVRVTGVAKNTVTKLLVDLGAACSEYQDAAFTNLPCKVVECDEIWAYCYSKQKNVPEEYRGTFGYGDVWTWTAIDADTKLVPSWLVGERTMADAYTFLSDLKSRLRNARIQLTTDGLGHYLRVVDGLWADNIDFAMLHKIYGGSGSDTPERTYSPAVCTGIDIKVIAGNPDPDRISTSYVERQNLSMRMGMRRFTRLTNAFSKKVENLAHAVSLNFMYYNFCRVHSSLTMINADGTRTKRTPAMAAGIATYPWSVTQIAQLID